MTRPLFCYYGDDFTGSTDALEALASNGVLTALFLDPPDDKTLADFPDCLAIGVAGESRSRDPGWMSEHLPAVFERLKQYGAPLCQYKVCSTFDSSPSIGSIGRALDIGKEIFQTPFVPVVVAAPHLGRYVLFGNLFAAGGGVVHRIDRHPTMGRHPVTPMDEGDLRLHLARQTGAKIRLLDLLVLRNGSADRVLGQLVDGGAEAVIFDGFDERTLADTGRLVANERFAIGSSGLTYALIHHWRACGLIPSSFTPETPPAADRLIVLSGSCSPVTESQIRWAMAHGFVGFRFGEEHGARAALAEGRSVVLYSALGPADCAGGLRGQPLGQMMGDTLRGLLLDSGVRRAVIAGGDTSTWAVRRLGIRALTYAGPTVPGAPLCRSHAETSDMDGMELVLKGGQVGPDNFFELVKRGRA